MKESLRARWSWRFKVNGPGKGRQEPECISVLASRCGGSFNPEPAATVRPASAVGVASGLNDPKIAQRNGGNAPQEPSGGAER